MMCNHQQRHGTLERTRDGKHVLYCRMRGYVTSRGGFTKRMRHAARFNGAGEAVRYAQVLGFAIVRWF